MAEKIITCSECQGMFDVGHIPPGRDVKCPTCGNSIVVPGERPATGSGIRPKTVAPGSSPRMATAPGTSPGSRVGPALKRSTPLMRRVNKSRPGQREPGSLSGSRHAIPVRKGPNLALIFSLVGVVVVVVILLFVLNKEKPRGTPVARKTEVGETAAIPAKAGSPKPAAAPAENAPRAVEVGGKSGEPAAAPAGEPPKVLAAFKEGSDGGGVDGWSVDAALVAEVEKKLADSYAKDPIKGDPDIRKELVTQSDKYFKAVADRLRSDKEGVAKEAASVANLLLKKHDIQIGKGDFIPDLALCNDPEKRGIFFREMREAWDKAQDRIKSDASGGDAAGSGSEAAMGGASDVVGALKRGGIDREEVMKKLKSSPGRAVRELIPYLKTEDPLSGRAVANALNELTGANIDVPRPADYGNGEELKKKWEDWLVSNLDKLK